MKSLLFLALLASANAGGENVARSAALGALLGAAHGREGFADWMYSGLKQHNKMSQQKTLFN